jgi:cyanate permease
VGPYIVGYLSKATGSFFAGVLYLSSSALAAAVLILALRAAKQKRLTATTEEGGRGNDER